MTRQDGGRTPDRPGAALTDATPPALPQASALLYASWSLKAHPDEGGLTEDQARLVRGWKRRLTAAGVRQLATFAQTAQLRADGALPWPAVTVEPFSADLVDRLVAGEDAAATPPVIPALAPWLDSRGGAPSADAAAAPSAAASAAPAAEAAAASAGGPELAEVRDQYRSEVAQAGAAFDPVRPVAANPTVATRSDDQVVIVDETTAAVAVLFTAAWETALRALVTSAADEADGAAATTARQLLSTVVRPLGEALSQLPLGGEHPPAACAGATFVDLAGAAAPAPATERLWRLALDATRLSSQPGIPAEVREAAAALQDLACPAAEPDRADQVAELRALQDGMLASLQTVTNGPYLLTNVDNVETALGEPIATLPLAALCRCGQSETKPFCDGSHARVEFTDRADPSRVPDQRDTYRGVQVTVLDNRGTCAHSGFCTDSVPAAFRLGTEPFVAPSAGRLDDIVNAVRACPSGALSYAIGDREAREQVDRQRPPRVEVSKDGPYRITGGIRLLDARGNDVPRNAGASREHYSLCRCGHSQNKPFCSGMHWYMDFHDPPPPENPTLFQWAGGLPALLRMTRAFYSRYVPEEPLLAPLFGNMSPDHPERVAAWLGEVFGGPTYYSNRYGGYPRMVSEHIGKHITEDHRSRWVQLMCHAANDAKLPADAEFRAAFVAYLEWGSRLAVENSSIGAKPPEGMPVPRWWWVCDATPEARVSAFAHLEQASQEEEPVVLPAPDEPVSFAQHVKPLFRTRDQQAMRFRFDLSSYDDVRAHGAGILERLRNGTMPCDGQWPEEWVQVFQRWLDSGTPA